MDVAVRRLTLERLGLTRYGAVHENLPPARLIEAAVRRREGVLAGNGSLVAKTGKRTGRSPKDRFIIEDEVTRDRVNWGKTNKPFSAEAFEALLEKATGHLGALEEFYVVDAYAGADPRYRLNVQVVTEYAWHALFARQLFRRPSPQELETFEPEWTVISVPGFFSDPEVGGTGYAGEIKKSIFTVLNFVLPTEHAVLPMHCSANVGEKGDVALFFGLSGTGKTTLSADPVRMLLGDDEHGWSDEGVFNFEGGCYAKTIDLSPEKEPQIYNAIRFGSVLENVVVDRQSREVDYEDPFLTENTRAAYPLEYIENSVSSGMAGHPEAVLFLTADAFGVLPPISILDPEQAAYYFLSGYTAKLAGTEAGMESEVEATFSTCFGAPFLPLPPTTYASMLSEKMREHGTRCYLVNTGWTGGPYGVGNRIDITETRAMVRAAITGELDDIETWEHPVFGLHVPKEVPGVPSHVLDPRGTWSDEEAYDEQAKELARLFAENFKKFEDQVSKEVLKAGPTN